MPRFVILEHDHPTLHWDLMLEEGEVLATWRLPEPPPVGPRTLLAERIGKHRRAYLDYEGPVSGNRGSVKRWDHGEYVETTDSPWIHILGEKWKGRIAVRAVDEGHEFVFDPDLVGPPVLLRIPAGIIPVGRLVDGRQFMAFVSGAFPDGYLCKFDTEEWRKAKEWLAILHLFDAEGRHLSSEVERGGYDVEGRELADDKASQKLDRMISPLRRLRPKQSDIHVRLFCHVIDGITHGLIYEASQPEEDGPHFEAVLLQPRDIMFHPPWDSGAWSS